MKKKYNFLLIIFLIILIIFLFLLIYNNFNILNNNNNNDNFDILNNNDNNIIIPKIIMQTAKEKPQQYIVDMIKNKCPGWEYQHYVDNDIISFFNDNPIDEFPNIIAKFNSIKNGAHKADIFRYYFLYIKGGIFIDSDAMIYDNIENNIQNIDFFTVESSFITNTVFQGFLGTTPKHPLIYKALKDIYNISLNELDNFYHVLCKNLYDFIIEFKNENNDNKILLFKELSKVNYDSLFINDNNIKIFNNKLLNNTNDYFELILNNDNKIIMIHYFHSKIIPYQ
jgi:hypothetical protein